MLDLNEVYNGNCLDVMKEIEDESVEVILTDLPYGTTAAAWDSVIPFEPMWEQYNRILKPHGAIVLFSSGKFTPQLIMSNLNCYKYSWVWNKSLLSGFLNAKYRPMQRTEDVCVFSRKKGERINYYPIMEQRDKPVKIKYASGKCSLYKHAHIECAPEYTHKYPTNVLNFNLSQNNRINPTQKPIELLEYLIKTYSKEGDLILDSCSGSGSTCLAAKNINRNYIGIELNKVYYEASLKYIEGCTTREVIKMFPNLKEQS